LTSYSGFKCALSQETTNSIAARLFERVCGMHIVQTSILDGVAESQKTSKFKIKNAGTLI